MSLESRLRRLEQEEAEMLAPPLEVFWIWRCLNDPEHYWFEGKRMTKEAIYAMVGRPACFFIFAAKTDEPPSRG